MGQLKKKRSQKRRHKRPLVRLESWKKVEQSRVLKRMRLQLKTHTKKKKCRPLRQRLEETFWKFSCALEAKQQQEATEERRLKSMICLSLEKITQVKNRVVKRLRCKAPKQSAMHERLSPGEPP